MSVQFHGIISVCEIRTLYTLELDVPYRLEVLAFSEEMVFALWELYRIDAFNKHFQYKFTVFKKWN